jgi:ketosteroid isomerase-like protein
MTAEENTTVVKATYAAFKSGDFDTLFASYASDVQWEVYGPKSLPTAGTWNGIDGIKAFFATLDREMSVRSFENREYIAQGDQVVVLGDYAWTAKTTGRPFESNFAHVVTLKDGKISRFREYTDTAVAAAAFGS